MARMSIRLVSFHISPHAYIDPIKRLKFHLLQPQKAPHRIKPGAGQ